jgi:hypothetical protein
MMRVKLMIASALAVSMVGVPAVFAQGATNAGADTTCTDFVAMDATAQADLLAQLGTSGGMSSSMSTGTSSGSGSTTAAPDSGSEAGSLGSGEAAAGGSMVAAAVLAACQNDPSLTVGKALSAGTGG